MMSVFLLFDKLVKIGRSATVNCYKHIVGLGGKELLFLGKNS